MEVEPQDKLELVLTWIDTMQFSRSKKNIARDFSDGVLMAELLKQCFPKIVDLHNYFPASSKTSKINNWSLLNKKVLSKINLELTKESILKLATATPGAIEQILLDVYEKVKKKQIEKEREEMMLIESFLGNSEQIVKIPSKDQSGDENYVPLTVYMKKQEELMEKDQIISCLKQRLTHVESLLQLKNEQIQELSSQIEHYTQSLPPEENFTVYN